MDKALRRLLVETRGLKADKAELQREISDIARDVAKLGLDTTEESIGATGLDQEAPESKAEVNTESYDMTEFVNDLCALKTGLTNLTEAIMAMEKGVTDLKTGMKLMWNDIKRMDKTLGKQEVSIRQLAREL